MPDICASKSKMPIDRSADTVSYAKNDTTNLPRTKTQRVAKMKKRQNHRNVVL